MKKIILLLSILILTLHIPLRADHTAGSKISWKCIKSGPNVGKYVFRLYLYRYCEGIPFWNSATLNSNSPAGNIFVNRIMVRDISPSCYQGQEIDCNDPNKAGYAIDEHIYESVPITINGVPPAGGWEFTWTSCCRPDPVLYGWGYVVDNLNPQNQSFLCKAIMYPYNGQNANPCFDSSPDFAETPATIICTGYEFTYNHNAVDDELDSLSYSWTTPFQSSGAPVTYATNLNTSQTTPRPNSGGFIVPAPGFSPTVPLPWSHPNMDIRNEPAQINNKTGEIKFLSHTPGSYATAVRVDAFKCGIRVASIFIDIAVFLIDCAPLPPPFSHIYNVPPKVTFTLPDGTTDSTLNVSVLAGEYVKFKVQAQDAGLLPGLISQTITIKPTGSQLGASYSDSLTGCPDTPCALIDTSNAYYVTADSSWKGVSQISTDFSWQTNCNHLAKSVGLCFVRSNVYTFVFKVLDDYCPAPGSNFVTASVTINAPDPLEPPKLKCINILPNGDVNLSWNVPVPDSADTANSFRKYVIFRANSRTATTYTAIDTVTDQDISSYLDIGANANVSEKYYFIMGVSSCNDQSQLIESDTLGALTLAGTALAAGDTAYLNWSEYLKPSVFPSTTLPQYYIWQIYNNDTLLIDSTTVSEARLSLNSCLGTKLCYPSNVDYYIEVRDTTSGWECSSFSNVISLTVGDNTPPVAPALDVVSIDSTSGDIHINWHPSIDCDAFMYYIWENGTIIDSVSAPDTNYIQPSPTGSNYNIPPASYSISARDSCYNYGVAGTAHTTMEAMINGAGVIRCDAAKKIPVTFGGYTGWPVTQYVMYADSGTGFYPIATFTPPYTFPITFNHTQLGTHFYIYKVRAFNASGEFSESSADSLSFNIVDATVIDPPDLRCVSIDENNDIRLTWIKPLNTSFNFDSYIIEHSTDGISFTVLDSITGSSRSDNSAHDSLGYTHQSVDPSVNHYYRVYSRSGCYGFTLSAPSATMQYLKLEAIKEETNVNQLAWSFNPLPDYLDYELLRDHPYGSGLNPYANVIKTTTNFFDTINNCNDTAGYQVIIFDNFGKCYSRSNVVEGIYRDNIPPSKQFLDSVSVRDDTNAIIGWSPNTSGDVKNYYVIRKNGSSFTIEDTISASQLSYMDVNRKGCYAIVAVDSCSNHLLAQEDFDYHCTMGVSVDIDRCDQSFLVQWNPYTTFKSGKQASYEVFYGVNSTNFKSLGVTELNNMRFQNPISGNNYCFFVRATENSGAGPFTSTSDSVCVKADFLTKPEYAYMQHVTVRDSNEVELSIWVDLRADVAEYLIKRGLDTNNMKTIATVQVPTVLTPADSTLQYTDRTPRTALKTYYYKVEVVDPCGDIVFGSNYGTNVLLQVEANNESKQNTLSWTSYLDWESGVQAYKIYRSSEGPFKFVSTVQAEDPNPNSYIDDVSEFNEQSEGLFCYYVEAHERAPLFPGLTEPAISRSNQVCVIQYPLFFVPSAFTPGEGNSPGLNDIFKPEGVFVSYTDYHFEVYNRWGELVFSTNDFEKGWDGTVEGKPAPNGAYIYFIRYRGVDTKREFEQKGTITIAR